MLQTQGVQHAKTFEVHRVEHGDGVVVEVEGMQCFGGDTEPGRRGETVVAKVQEAELK